MLQGEIESFRERVYRYIRQRRSLAAKEKDAFISITIVIIIIITTNIIKRIIVLLN